MQDRAGRNTHWLVIFRDITDRKHLERKILEISERERRRIGQDLHDGLGQHLAGIELMSQVLEQELASKNKTAAMKVNEIGRYVRDAISQTRSLARGFSPVTLESEGLLSALKDHGDDAEDVPSGLPAGFEGGSGNSRFGGGNPSISDRAGSGFQRDKAWQGERSSDSA